MRKSRWIILFLSLIIFLYIAENVWNQEMMILDVKGYNFISKYLISDFTTPIAKIITQFGGAIILVTVAILSLIIIKNKKIGIAICSNLAIISILNWVLKVIVQRPRPTEFRLIGQSGYSFPSGHSMISMAFYGFIMYLIYKKVENKYLKWGLITFLGLLIICIGTSRIYLGVHYTSDVIAGFLISIAYLMVFTNVVKKYIIDTEKRD